MDRGIQALVSYPRPPWDEFAADWLTDLLWVVGSMYLVDKRRVELKEREKSAPEDELPMIKKLWSLWGALSFECRAYGSVSADLITWVRTDFPGADLSRYELDAPSFPCPRGAVPFLSLSNPIDDYTLAFLQRADPATVRSVFMECAPPFIEYWKRLLEIMNTWTCLENVSFSGLFFNSGDECKAVVKLLVENLEKVEKFTFYGPVVKAVGPDFFKNTRARAFSFPSAVRCESRGVFYPLFEGCTKAEIADFCEGLPVKIVSFGAQDYGDSDTPQPEDLEPLVGAVSALSSAAVVLDGVPGVGSSLEMLAVLFGGDFESVNLTGASTELPICPQLAGIVASNLTLRSLEVGNFGEFACTVLEASLSIRSFSFAHLEHAVDVYKKCVLESELESLTCHSFDTRAAGLCKEFEEAKEDAEQRALCLLHCCLSLAPRAHEHIVPSIGAVPVPVLQQAVEDAGALVAEKVENSPREDREKRGLDSPDEQESPKRR